ncbi:MAG: hypothetical protein LLG00_05995 [Planctomycetaceae bacterium]|nr:hypothetical protein [Planctomycetaceae bacterium]
MKPWQLLLLGFSLLATAGCRTDPALAFLERDNFRKDQEIWRLRGCIEDLQDELNACRQRAEGPREGDRAPRRLRSVAPAASAVPETPEAGQPNIEMPTQAVPEVPEELKRPSRRIPHELRESPEHRPGSTEPGGPSLEVPGTGEEQSPQQRHAPVSYEEEIPQAQPDASEESRQVSAITLDKRLTGGIAGDDGRGDRGLLVVVEPRDATGRTIEAPAKVSVVAYDAAVKDDEGHAVLVARWDYSAAETAVLFRRNGQEHTIHLAGGWGKETPKHSQLDVFVRYVTADGRNLEAHRSVEVALRSNHMPRRDDSIRMARRDDRSDSHRPTWSPNR